jgi:hypothetical protein
MSPKEFGDLLRAGSLLTEVNGELKSEGSQIVQPGEPISMGRAEPIPETA